MSNWQTIIEEEQAKSYFKNIIDTVSQDRLIGEVYPPKEQLFTAFQLCPLSKVKVVILGQDVYHQPNQAHGLAFSVNKGVKVPPSLQNIFKELKNDLNVDPPNHGYLASWANQGILLLNSALTVKRGQPGSHIKIWEPFTITIMQTLNKQDRPIVYLMWGKFAQSKAKHIDNPKHKVLNSGHPSFYSQHLFFGCKHFSQTNKFLIDAGLNPIDWKISQ